MNDKERIKELEEQNKQLKMLILKLLKEKDKNKHRQPELDFC